VATASAWLGERPDEPQLPLYALVQHKEVSAVAFANIRAGESSYIGVTRDRALMGIDEAALKDIRQIPVTRGTSSFKCYDSWDSMLAEWRQTINTLAAHHVHGEAQVAPKDENQTCRYCDVMSVCRLFDRHDESGEA
jgi:hypothetical protein